MSKAIITENIRANLPAIVVLSLLGGAFTTGALASTLMSRITHLEIESYTKSDAVELAWRMAMANPNLRVPDPRDPTSFLVYVTEGHAK